MHVVTQCAEKNLGIAATNGCDSHVISMPHIGEQAEILGQIWLWLPRLSTASTHTHAAHANGSIYDHSIKQSHFNA